MNTLSSEYLNEKAIVRKALSALSTRDFHTFGDLLSDKLHFRVTGSHDLSGDYYGKANAARIEGLINEFADGPHYEITQMLQDGNIVISIFVGTGKFKSGKDYHNEYAVLWQIEGQEITGVTEFFDSYHVLNDHP